MKLALLLLCCCACTLRAQTLRYDDHVYQPGIHSVQLYKGNNQLSYPILSLNDQSMPLVLTFDDLATSVADYYITLVHCDHDWVPSALMPLEFYEGYAYDRIMQFAPSQQTKVQYVHYQAQLPMANGRFKRSGNYLIKVYKDGDERQLVITRRMVVAEALVSIAPQVGFSQQVEQRLRLQQVQFALAPGALPVRDLYNEIRVQVLQNFRWDNAQTNLRPAYAYPDHWEYALSAQNDFSGGNEYRTLDLRSVRGTGQGVATADCSGAECQVQLQPDQVRTANTYLSNPDINGNYLTGISAMEQRLGVFQPDYVLVNFALRMHELAAGQVYLFGAFTDWRAQPVYQLHYDKLQGAYTAQVLLKQGLYNYHYVVTNAQGQVDEAALEGTHFETENSYAILVYYRALGERTDRLVGLRLVNYYDADTR